MKAAFAIAPLLLLAGCGASTATRFWTIEPVAPPSPSAAAAAGRAIVPIWVGAVHVPLAIDRLEIVRHDAENRVAVDDFDRWSAPPGDLIRRALTQDLVGRLPAGTVLFPEDAVAPTMRTIVVDVLDLRPTAAGFAMDVSWSAAAEGAAGRPLLRRQLHLETPATARDAGAQVVALGQLTGQLADSIADAVRAGR